MTNKVVLFGKDPLPLRELAFRLDVLQQSEHILHEIEKTPFNGKESVASNFYGFSKQKAVLSTYYKTETQLKVASTNSSVTKFEFKEKNFFLAMRRIKKYIELVFPEKTSITSKFSFRKKYPFFKEPSLHQSSLLERVSFFQKTLCDFQC